MNSDEITVTAMTATDLDAVLSLWRQTSGIGLNESDTPEQLQGYLGRNPGLSLVAYDGARLVGAVLCGHDGRRGYLHHLAVLPDCRGRGLGRRLGDTCLAALRNLGIPKCNIFLYADNEAGERFWNRCGWTPRIDLRVLQHGTAPQ